MKRVSWWGAMIGVVFTISVMQSDPATSLSWAESDNTLVYERTMPSPPSEYRGIPGCVDMPMTVLGYMELQSMCVYTAPDVLFAVPSRFSGTESGLYVSVSGEPFVRIVGSDEGGSYLVRPGTNTLITIRYFGETSMLSISIDMHKHLTRYYGYSDFEYEYLAGSSPGGFWLDSDEYDMLYVRSMQMTPDGKYLLVDVYETGLVRVNLDSYEVRMITSEQFDPIWGYRYQYSISDSGQMVAVAKVTGEVLIYDLYQPCGVIAQEVRLLTAEESCKPTDLTPSVRAFLELREGQNYILAEMVKPEFVGDFQVSVGRFDYQGRRVELTLVAQSRQSSDLDYLALGDSFSSGEGDIGRWANGSSYYAPETDYEFGCHLSNRSYPFLLRNAWEIPHTKMKSVACSGAKMIPDYYGGPGSYAGQEGRLKEANDVEEAQLAALGNFTPGHVQQIEFVRKYQPKLVTLTGGGNDVGFAVVLLACASPSLGDAIPGMNSDCSYVDEDSGAHKALLHAIDMQIPITKQLISRIQSASLNTKIVIVGYPSFVNHDSSVCLPNAGVLSRNERRMINDMTTRLNDALRRAAHEMDVSYVDIEDSLTGGRLCEGGQYVTGVWAAIQGDAMDQEQFHPNAQGHEKMATTIVNSGVHTTDLVPVQATYRMSEDFVKTYQKELVRRDIIMRRSGAPIQLEWGHLARNTEYRLDVHSTPTYLGTFMTNDDGSIDREVSFEDVSPGYHMLILEGIGVTGEKTRLYQFIEVHASPDDADGDGIKNEDDECKFIPFMFDEQGENICEKGLSPEDTTRAIAQKERAIRILRESNSDILESIPEHERGGEEESVVADNKSVDNDLGVTKRKVASGALIAIAVLVAIVGAGIIIISWRRAHARKNIG